LLLRFLHHRFTRTDPAGWIYVALHNADSFEQFSHMLFAHDLNVLLYSPPRSFSYTIANLLLHKHPDLFGDIGPRGQLRDSFTDESAF
jgi:hypothetical protein